MVEPKDNISHAEYCFHDTCANNMFHINLFRVFTVHTSGMGIVKTHSYKQSRRHKTTCHCTSVSAVLTLQHNVEMTWVDFVSASLFMRYCLSYKHNTCFVYYTQRRNDNVYSTVQYIARSTWMGANTCNI